MKRSWTGATLLPDASEFLAEVLGRPVGERFDPAASGFLCPFVASPCTKRSAKLDEPYPVCTIRTRRQGNVCVCPKRFYAVDFLGEVVEYCWPASHPPANPQIAPEVQMKGFGNVDFVIADIDEDGDVAQFLSVELQAIDITGSVMPAYQAWRAGKSLNKNPKYGLNWDNVYKRYITQLIRKGYFHHHWGTKIVAVIQDVVYQYITERFEFMRSPNVSSSNINVIFMVYGFEPDPKDLGSLRPTLRTVEGTHHANLQQAILYKEPPSRAAFCERIRRSIESHGEGAG